MIIVWWIGYFDETTVAPDAAYADGYVTNGFYGTDVEVWYGFLILSRPTTRESCENLTSDWLLTLDQIKADRRFWIWTTDRRFDDVDGDRGVCILGLAFRCCVHGDPFDDGVR